jgi:hypothetical protein
MTVFVASFARRAPRAAVALVLVGLLGLCLAGLPAGAQEDAPEIELILSDTPANKDLVLRPNSEREVLVSVKNNGENEKTVAVQVVADGFKETSPLVKVPGEKTASVSWPATDKKATTFTKLKGRVSIQVVDEKGKALGAAKQVLIGRPSDFLKASLKWIPGENNRLEALVSLASDAKGPPYKVQLVLLPESIPAYKVGQPKVGWYADKLDAKSKDKEILLEARNLQLAEKEKSEGLVYLTVDDYPRAFTFNTTFSPDVTGAPQRPPSPGVTFRVPPFGDPSKPVPAVLWVDDLPTDDEENTVLVKVELVRQADKKEKVSELAEYRGARQRTLEFAPRGPNGGILFKNTVKDWITNLDLSSAQGQVDLRVRLLRADGKEITFYDRDRLEGKPQGIQELTRTMVLDGTPPQNLKWVGPKQAFRGRPLVLQATGDDPESRISRVLFWVGRPGPDGKIPPGTEYISGKLLEGKEKIWATTLAVPLDQGAVLTVSARFINGAGLATNLTTQLPVIDPKIPVKVVAKKKASIAGTVTEGDRPQVGLPVQLRDAAGKIVETTKTTAGGAYLFKGLDPGSYRVTATKSASRTRGTKIVAVIEAETKTGVLIKLYR